MSAVLFVFGNPEINWVFERVEEEDEKEEGEREDEEEEKSCEFVEVRLRPLPPKLEGEAVGARKNKQA